MYDHADEAENERQEIVASCVSSEASGNDTMFIMEMTGILSY